METYLIGLDAWMWRYLENKRNYPGVHFTARAPSCVALLRCLDALEMEGPRSHRTIPLRVLNPADEAKITGGQRFASFGVLSLRISEASDELMQLQVAYVGERAIVEVTPATVGHLRQGFEDVRDGKGDWALALDPKLGPLGTRDPQSLPLWFWPCFGHTSPVGSAWRRGARR